MNMVGEWVEPSTRVITRSNEIRSGTWIRKSLKKKWVGILLHSPAKTQSFLLFCIDDCDTGSLNESTRMWMFILMFTLRVVPGRFRSFCQSCHLPSLVWKLLLLDWIIAVHEQMFKLKLVNRQSKLAVFYRVRVFFLLQTKWIISHILLGRTTCKISEIETIINNLHSSHKYPDDPSFCLSFARKR